MLTRAFVVDVGRVGTQHECKLKIRMPIINGIEGEKESTADADLSWAAIMCIPGLDVQYIIGDVVIVGFEDNDLDYPIVLGHLKVNGRNVNRGARVSGDVQNLTVEDRFNAPTSSIIGKTAYDSIFNSINNKDEAKLDGISFDPKTGELIIRSTPGVTTVREEKL